MTVKPRSPRTPSHKASVLRLIPTITKPLNAECSQVVRKLKAALTTAQSGATAGMLLVALDEKGNWTADLAGQLAHDSETLRQIVYRLFSACLALNDHA